MAAALALAGKGWTTYATTRSTSETAELERHGIRVLHLDVTDEASIRAAFQIIDAEHEAVDVLINNAAYGQMGAVEEVPLDLVRRQFETNVFGLVRMSQMVLPGMRRKGWGRIINLSSMGGEFTTPFAGFYHATKYAVEAISNALRMEVEQFGIDVVVVQPGGINTPMAHRTTDSIATVAGSPYENDIAAFRTVSAAAMKMTEMMVTPQRVAEIILEAVQADKPLTRYKVTPADMTETNTQRDAADRQGDNALRQQLGMTTTA
jgi:NAD(P)-dependent dehydrogenase (short-subunit alcohol dehydrogenase family)